LLALDRKGMFGVKGAAASRLSRQSFQVHRTRYDEISQELNKRLVMDESQAFCAKATFQAPEQEKSGPGWKPLIVEWTKVSCQDAVDNRINVKW
jgi:hypothetical protein